MIVGAVAVEHPTCRRIHTGRLETAGTGTQERVSQLESLPRVPNDTVSERTLHVVDLILQRNLFDGGHTVAQDEQLHFA